MIKNWKWCGIAGHCIIGSQCRYHLCTRVGNYRISTIGDWHMPRQGEDSKATEIGVNRLYETMVFKLKKSSKKDECKNCRDIKDWSELECVGYNDWNEANAGHMKMCLKYDKEAS